MSRIVHKVDHEGNDEVPLLGALLRAPFLAVRGSIVSQLHQAGFTDIQPAHLAVFQHPGPEGRTPGEVARTALASKQAMNNLLTQLERGGYLRREVKSANRRERTVALTPRGREVIAAIRRAVSEIEDEWQRSLGRARYDNLRALLRELNGVITTSD